MEENYDCIILGTGYKECLVSGLLAHSGKKILHIDRNPFYGMDNATLSFEEFQKHFPELNDTLKQDRLGNTRDFAIDLCAKTVLASGEMFKVLIATGVNRYMDFTKIEETYVYMNKTLSKVPTTPSEALTSSLIGLFQKNRLRVFLSFIDSCKEPFGKEISDQSAAELMDYYKLDKKSQALVYHVLALNITEKEVEKKGSAINLIRSIKLFQYALLLAKKSPFIYPQYGLGMLPEGFGRLAAVYNGVYMLNKPLDSLLVENEEVKGIVSKGEKAYAPVVVANHSYFADFCETHAKIGRLIMLFDEQPLKHKRDQLSSFQCIIPGVEFNRKNDVYITCLSYAQKVSPKGKYLLMISCIIERDDGSLKTQLEKFVVPIFFKNDWRKKLVGDVYEEKPLKVEKDGCGIPKGLYIIGSVDASSHFEEDTKDVFKIYERITGEVLDLKNIVREDLVNN